MFSKRQVKLLSKKLLKLFLQMCWRQQFKEFPPKTNWKVILFSEFSNLNDIKIKTNYQNLTKFSEFDLIYIYIYKQWKFQGLEIILPEVINKSEKCWN